MQGSCPSGRSLCNRGAPPFGKEVQLRNAPKVYPKACSIEAGCGWLQGKNSWLSFAPKSGSPSGIEVQIRSAPKVHPNCSRPLRSLYLIGLGTSRCIPSLFRSRRATIETSVRLNLDHREFSISWITPRNCASY